MKFSASAAFLAISGLVSSTAVSLQEIEPQDVSKYVRISFDKLRGDTAEDARVGLMPRAELVKRADGSETIKIKNQNNFYSVEVGVGSPAQNVTLLIDTGSSDMWVMGSNNPFCEGSSRSSKHVLLGENIGLEDETVKKDFFSSFRSLLTATATSTVSASAVAPSRTSVAASDATLSCSSYGTFATGSSSSFKSNNTDFYIQYGDLTYALGTWGHDDVTLQDITVSDLSMAVANESNSTFGVLGIGLTGLEVTNVGSLVSSSRSAYTYQNLPALLVDQGKIHQNAYSLFLDDLDAEHGSVLFGAVDHSKYTGNLYTVPLVNIYKSSGFPDPIQLDVTLQGLGMSANKTNITFTTTPIPALLDSGTTLTYLPSSMVQSIARRLSAQYSYDVGYYVLDCSEVSDSDELVFDFGGFHIKSKLQNFLIKASSNFCALGLVPQSSSRAILGDNFLTAAYVVYDLENLEVSMAQANYDGGSEDIEVISSTIPGAVKAPGYSSTWSSRIPISTGGNIFTVSGGNSTSTRTASGSSSASSGRSATTSTSNKQNAAAGVMMPGTYSVLSGLFLFVGAALI